MDEANFMQTVCWQTRPLAIKPAVGKRHSASRIFLSWYSADRNSAANPDIGCSWGHCWLCPPSVPAVLQVAESLRTLHWISRVLQPRADKTDLGSAYSSCRLCLASESLPTTSTTPDPSVTRARARTHTHTTRIVSQNSHQILSNNEIYDKNLKNKCSQ